MFNWFYKLSDKEMDTPLFKAILAGDFDVLKCVLLMELMEMITEVDSEGRTLLHHASINGDIKLVKYLIMSGADIDATCHKGQTPLMVATINNHDTIVDVLRENNADVDIVDKDGYTALHHAAKKNSASTTKLLLNYASRPKDDGTIRLVNFFPTQPTADIFIENTVGQRPIDLAKLETADLLKEAEKLSKALSESIKNNDADNILLCLTSGACVTDEIVEQSKDDKRITEWLSEAAPNKIRRSVK